MNPTYPSRFQLTEYVGLLMIRGTTLICKWGCRMGRHRTEYYDKLQEPVRAFFDRQHRDAYLLLDACRHNRTGLYADGYITKGVNPERRCSIAATGVGLIGLCVADEEGWDPGALTKAKTTLLAVTGEIEGCRPERDAATGFYRHFIDIESGVNLHSEVSTIDTAILVIGALFAGRHFGDREPGLAQRAEQLLHSIDWRVIVADSEHGAIHMVLKNGQGTAPIWPYNEYVLVAYLAVLALPDNQDIRELWNRSFAEASLQRLPQAHYRDLSVLTDHVEGRAFLSSFVHQFPFYLVGDYAQSPVYRRFYEQACMADRLKWKELSDVPSYVWGYGAGPNDGLYGGYHADRILESPGHIASAYIVAGFLPVYPAGIQDLYAIYRLHLPYDRYTNPGDLHDEAKLRAAYRYGLHRYSWWHLTPEDRWYPEKVTVIDWSSMLYGLTAYKHGMSFFTDRLPTAEEVLRLSKDEAG